MKKKKKNPQLRQEVKVKVDIVTSDDIKIYYTGKFQDFTARYMYIVKSLYYSLHRRNRHVLRVNECIKKSEENLVSYN